MIDSFLIYFINFTDISRFLQSAKLPFWGSFFIHFVAIIAFSECIVGPLSKL